MTGYIPIGPFELAKGGLDFEVDGHRVVLEPSPSAVRVLVWNRYDPNGQPFQRNVGGVPAPDGQIAELVREKVREFEETKRRLEVNETAALGVIDALEVTRWVRRERD